MEQRIRFERSDYGWHVWVRRQNNPWGDCYVYFGHYYTQRDARASLKLESR